VKLIYDVCFNVSTQSVHFLCRTDWVVPVAAGVGGGLVLIFLIIGLCCWLRGGNERKHSSHRGRRDDRRRDHVSIRPNFIQTFYKTQKTKQHTKPNTRIQHKIASMHGISRALIT